VAGPRPATFVLKDLAMSTIYDPNHPKYADETDLRAEMDRVFDLCHGCRLCFKFCQSFPSMFEMIDAIEEQDSSQMTPGQQDQVVDECFNCKLCHVNCPYTPSKGHDWELDFPRLMLRAQYVLREKRPKFTAEHMSDKLSAKTDLVGKVGTAIAPAANLAIAKEGTPIRRIMARVTGIAPQRSLPLYANQRFTTWFKKRSSEVVDPQARVAVFPTCLVDYQHPEIGQATVQVFEHNKVSCSVPDGVGCCGAPHLHSGDVAAYKKQSEKILPGLVAAVQRGEDIVVSQPTCSYVLKKDLPDYLDTDDARLVAEHTYDACEYLDRLRRDDESFFDEEFPGEVPEQITYHASCHLKAQEVGIRGRDLLKRTGAKIKFVSECSGIDGMWGLKERNYEMAKAVGADLSKAVEKHDSEVVVGDCALANGGITEDTGRLTQHPLEVLARAYGIAPESDAKPK
jgi:glycerol-3-phosphate dehydrogenase subunit C